MNNPYTPGYGAIPPVLAGREEELNEVREVASRLLRNESYPRDIILFGPRGNGKTALLSTVQRELKKKRKLQVVKIMATHIADRERLCMSLFDVSPKTSETIRTNGTIGAPRLAGGERERSQVFQFSSPDVLALARKRWRGKATLLMVDEAHRITQAAVDEIAALAREAKDGTFAFNFVLCGPPGLKSHLRSLDATFLNRANEIRLGRLSLDESKEALLTPLLSAGFEVDLEPDQKSGLVESTQGYPHFIQCIGHALWNGAEKHANRVDNRVLHEVRYNYERHITAMYGERLAELSEQRLVDAAIAIAELFKNDDSTIPESELLGTIGKIACSLDDERRYELMKKFINLGYIWQARDGQLAYEPGIPSLMSHVLAGHQESLERRSEEGYLER